MDLTSEAQCGSVTPYLSPSTPEEDEVRLDLGKYAVEWSQHWFLENGYT